MLIIPIKEGENIDRALKRYKRKFDKTVRQLKHVLRLLSHL
jgi:small subunit ribosomal protein S21